ncbi:LysR family transcriptional regulator [Leptothoe spongobia]|uniref:LysR family transcriptional regulator n=1 Tax=Leptothoe spongobia TAU-MAC 1115 TaxID=1967444 RepID=A0A947DJ83_9CYAN|nr:LysR family transcriptional regulator [Leptothoe spongobia]MBT9317948.1 LysR family transcriptional regulator [Leptothoe spongobia TAU-MAC 1115]
MDKLVALQVFRRVIELESFSRAAEDLHLSNAAVSKNVRELEQSLKTQLIQRTTRRLSLTETGQLYFQKVCSILDELATVEETVADLAVKPHGLLRVTAPMSLGLIHVATAIYQFQLAYPDIQLDLTFCDRYVDLIEEGFDVGIRGSGATPDSSLVMHRICEFPRVVCASPAYLQQSGEPRSPDELKQHQCVIYSLARSPYEWHFWQGNETIVAHVDGSVKVNNSLAASQAAIAGLGIIFLPIFVASEALKQGTLQIILQEWSTEPLSLYAICPKHRQRSRKLQAFVDFISDALASITR